MPVTAERRSMKSRVAVASRRTIRIGLIAARRPAPVRRPVPDFVIVGAQRCGTTSLFKALRQHPAVLGPVLKSKGVHYFDVAYRQPIDWYLAHFPTEWSRGLAARRAGSQPVAGEASPYYLFHPAAPARMADTLPNARLIVMLRDPIRRAYSHYHHMRFEGHEYAPTFEDAIDLEATRLAGEEERLLADPAYVSPSHQHHSYLARGDYATQLRKLLALFPRQQVLVIDSQRFFADSVAGVGDVLRFLGLSTNCVPALAALNAGTYPPLAPSTRSRLEDHFAASNAALPGLLGWTPSWCK